MAVLVAVTPGRSNAAALGLAGALAAALGEPVRAVAVVVVQPGVPPPLRDGMDDADALALIAAGALAEARAVLGPALAGAEAIGARSVRAGLREAAATAGASHVVLGSAATGAAGRVTPGHSAQALLADLAVPVAIAPAGRPAPGPAPITRVSAAFGMGEGDEAALATAARLAEAADARLRTVSVLVRGASSPAAASTHGYGGELARGWHEQTQADAEAALARLPALGLPTRFATAERGVGSAWPEAVDAVGWEPGDLFVLGARPRPRAARAVAGDPVAELLRAAPVPVLLLPG